MIELDGQRLTLEHIAAVALDKEKIELSPAALSRIERSRRVIERIIDNNETVYGVNTGFGKLADVHIPNDELRTLQLNLVRSHSCGLGQPLSASETRAMILLRTNVFACGFSGVRPIVARTLIEMLEADLNPVIPEKGSVGASGDLAPLAHLALAAIGEGKAVFGGREMPSAEALNLAGIIPLKLEAKEGLALLNGTQAMSAVGGLAILRAERLAKVADIAGAMTLDALRGTPAAFDERIHLARPHPHQLLVAERLRDLERGSEIRESHKTNDPRVQDAYSLRCIPQVHGAVRMALSHAREVVEVESGSATDNPLIFPAPEGEAYDVISGGNFHGAPLALVFDYAGIAITDLASISERRIERLVNPDLNEGLPPFLTKHAGTSSGFMIAQVSAVSLLSEMKVLAHPASVDNMPTSGGKEDHVSMGMTAALKLRNLVENAESVLAIELLAAAIGIDYRAPLKPGPAIAKAHSIIRELVAEFEEDRPLSDDISTIASAIRTGAFDDI